MKELLRKATLGVVLLLAAVSACADGIRTAQVDGLTWKYVVVDGGATIFGGQFREWDDEEGGYIWAFYPAIPEGTSGAISVPSSLGGYPVTAIGNGAFCECENLTSVKIPVGVTSIGEEAFTDCESMVEVDIPEGVVTIARDAFDGCYALAALELPWGVTTIGSRAFDDCRSLSSVEIPPTVTSIGYHAFCRCYSLQKVSAPSTLEQQVWENGVFNDCPLVELDFYNWSPGTVAVDVQEGVLAGERMTVTVRRVGGTDGKIAVKVKTQSSTGVCGTDFAYVKDVLVWEDGDSSDKEIEIPTYVSGSGKALRIKLATLTTGAYADCVKPTLAASKVYAEIMALNPGKIVVTAPDPLSVVAGETLRLTFSRTGGSDGSIAVKAKTQTSTALMGVNGSADFDYVKGVLEWADGDDSDRYLDIPTYVQPWEGVRMLRVKLATLATGAYDGNLTPALAESKVYADIESPVAFGTVSVEPESAAPVAGEPLRLVFRRVGGSDYPVAVKYKVQTSTAIAGQDFEYMKGVVTWGDGEDDDKEIEVPTYPSAAGKQLRVKLSTLTQGDHAGCVSPHVANTKVYVTFNGCDTCFDAL